MTRFHRLGYLLFLAFSMGVFSVAPARAAVEIQVAQFPIDVGHAPIQVTRSVTDRGNADIPEQCVAFRNISDKPVVDVVFVFEYNDTYGTAETSRVAAFSGDFGPPYEIEQRCTDLRIDEALIGDTRGVDIKVQSVTYKDGTSWTTGQGFVRAYSNAGAKLAQSIAVPPSVPIVFPGYLDRPAPISFTQNIIPQSGTPVEVLRGTTGFPFGSGTPQQCVNFRNHGSTALTNVTFAFNYKGASGNLIATQELEQPGHFSPLAEIDKKCVSSYLGRPASVATVTQVDIRVLGATFEDGTVWTASAP